MSKRSSLAAITLAALTLGLFSATSASAMFLTMVPPRQQPSAPTPSHGGPDLECRAKGTDFFIMNFGSTQIDSGRQVAWSSASTGDSGTVLVPGPLEPGQEFKLSDVLSDNAMRGAPCTADFAS
jgi:hypothetical protein